MDRPRIIFFGTPEFASTCLSRLYETTEIALVVTQPDRASQRGLKTSDSPVKQFAQQRGIEVIQPEKIRTYEFVERLKATSADLGVVVAYGRILPLSALQAPRLGCVNVHASLLPKLRGAAPIEWAIINGDGETGVSLMQLDEGMDTGPVLAVSKTPIGRHETASDLSRRLASMGAELLAAQLPRLMRGELQACPQDHARATQAPMLRKQDGQVSWNRSALRIHDLIRGVNPWPGAFSWLNEKRIILHRSRLVKEDGPNPEPGVILRADGSSLEVACAEGILAIEELQMEGKRRMSTEQFLSGSRWTPGMRFAESRI